jgi:hypothetical protein
MNLLIFKEKHSDRYFSFSTDEEKYRIACEVARDRLLDGWWYDTTPPSNQLDMFQRRAHMSDSEQISYLLARAEDLTLRKPGVTGSWYRREVYKWMLSRRSYQYEDFCEVRITAVTFPMVD